MSLLLTSQLWDQSRSHLLPFLSLPVSPMHPLPPSLLHLPVNLSLHARPSIAFRCNPNRTCHRVCTRARRIGVSQGGGREVILQCFGIKKLHTWFRSNCTRDYRLVFLYSRAFFPVQSHPP